MPIFIPEIIFKDQSVEELNDELTQKLDEIKANLNKIISLLPFVSSIYCFIQGYYKKK